MPPTLTNATGTTSKKGKLTEIINDGHKYMRDDILQIITKLEVFSNKITCHVIKISATTCT